METHGCLHCIQKERSLEVEFISHRHVWDKCWQYVHNFRECYFPKAISVGESEEIIALI